MIWPIIKSRGSSRSRVDVFVGVVGYRPSVGVGVAAAGQDIRRAGIRREHARAFVKFIPTLKINALQCGPRLVRLIPRIGKWPPAVARQERARVADVLVPVAAFELRGEDRPKLKRVVIASDLELWHLLVRET